MIKTKKCKVKVQKKITNSTTWFKLRLVTGYREAKLNSFFGKYCVKCSADNYCLYMYFISGKAHRGSILVPNPPNLEVSPGPKKSTSVLSLRRCSQGGNRRHSLQSFSIETETGPKFPNAARRGQS